ncbi:MAG: efflux RND transporter periplasmic adaptor subunit, partial [Bacteroidota bacterium]|nr:efflux RND transporter periplasmic adaptor subunit [Bacteroidota bacterium]
MITPFGAAAGSRGALVILADMSSLEVEADVSESNIEKIIPNQPCEITLDAIPQKRYRGFVHKIIPTADRAKATVLTKIRFVDRDDRVLPEMSAKVLFLNKKENNAVENSAPKLTVPSSAIVERNGHKAVFIVREEKVTETSVVIGESMGALVEIREGVVSGDKIVLHPSETLSSGTKIRTDEK